jgi:hypothetical protein
MCQGKENNTSNSFGRSLGSFHPMFLYHMCIYKIAMSNLKDNEWIKMEMICFLKEPKGQDELNNNDDNGCEKRHDPQGFSRDRPLIELNIRKLFRNPKQLD